jgi:hypothetical protein
MTRKILYTVLLIMFIVLQPVKGQKASLSFQNQLSGWTVLIFQIRSDIRSGQGIFQPLAPGGRSGRIAKSMLSYLSIHTGTCFFPEQILILPIIP